MNESPTSRTDHAPPSKTGSDLLPQTCAGKVTERPRFRFHSERIDRHIFSLFHPPDCRRQQIKFSGDGVDRLASSNPRPYFWKSNIGSFRYSVKNSVKFGARIRKPGLWIRATSPGGGVDKRMPYSCADIE